MQNEYIIKNRIESRDAKVSNESTNRLKYTRICITLPIQRSYSTQNRACIKSNQNMLQHTTHTHSSTSLLTGMYIYILYIYRDKHLPNPNPRIEANLLELNCPSVAIYIYRTKHSWVWVLIIISNQFLELCTSGSILKSQRKRILRTNRIMKNLKNLKT